MRILYHFRHSPFSRRTRLALAHKGLDCELREARESPAFRVEAAKLSPFRTVPVLVDDGRALGDSTAIAHWLDRAYPRAARLWPDGESAADVLQVAALVDVVLNGVIDVGTRYYALRKDPAFGAVTEEILGRSELALRALGERAAALGGATVATDGWCAADMWLLTLVLWFQGLPGRAASNPNIRQIVDLGVEVPQALGAWADVHRGRDDVKALD
jgi:glutathione S-transferase